MEFQQGLTFMNQIYQSAIAYRKSGFSIIPVILSKNQDFKIDKKPAVKWQEFQSRYATDEELKEWFEVKKYNGIGIVTGKISGIVVIDVDKGDFKIDTPLIAKTISGGQHYYFKWNRVINNTVRFIEGVDFRGDGGFVVAPPSFFDGSSYEWIKKESLNLPVLPDILIQKIDNPKPKVTSLYEGIFQKAKKGERNHRATQVAGWLLHKFPPTAWKDAYDLYKYWNSQNTPPLSDGEADSVWISIVSRESQKTEIQPQFSILTGLEAKAKYLYLNEKYGIGLTTGYMSLDYFFTLQPQQLYLISSATHQGKTTLALNICSRIALLGRSVLFVSLEQDVFIIPRIESIIGNTIPDNFKLLVSAKMLKVDDIIQAIKSMSEKPELVCIDHLHFIKKQGLGATADTEQMILEIQNMAKKLEIPVIVIAHTRKLNDARYPTMDDLKDSSALNQVPSVVIFIHREKDEATSLITNRGSILIAKNRIKGKLGERKFELLSTGDIYFDGEDKSMKEAKQVFYGDSENDEQN